MSMRGAQKRFWSHLVQSFQFVMPLAMAGCSVTAPATRNHPIQLDARLAISTASTNRIITALQMSRSLPTAKVEVNDPVSGKTKNYEGFWLEDVLRLAGIELSEEEMLVFTCLDGYQARLMRPTGPGARPLLAVRDLDSEDSWEVFFHGKEKTVPGPFYLVWETSRRAGEATNNHGASLPWPYQINQIDVRSSAESERRLFPVGAESRQDVRRGFELFSRSCIACHSINLEGGTLGPELNIPRNITEYRDWPYLAEFIKDPSSFRAKSKMPGFKNSLTDQQIDDVLQYLRWMRERKVVGIRP